MIYYKKSDNKIICNLCKHHCKLLKNQVGNCQINKNIDDKLETLVFNHPSIIEVNSIEEEALFHFLPDSKTLCVGTVGCNFKCPFCKTHEKSQSSIIDFDNTITKEQIVALALKYECKSILFTYNEPTIYYPFAKEVGLFAKSYNLKNIFKTNGFQSNDMVEDMVSWVDAVNVDFKSNSNSCYGEALGGNLDGVKENIIRLKELGIHMEISTLIIEDVNSAKEQLNAIAKFIANKVGVDTPWHLSSFTPSYKMSENNPTKLKSIMDGYDSGIKEGLRYIYFRNIPTSNETICPKCELSLIKRDRYATIYNHLENLKECPKCGTHIYGVW